MHLLPPLTPPPNDYFINLRDFFLSFPDISSFYNVRNPDEQ